MTKSRVQLQQLQESASIATSSEPRDVRFSSQALGCSLLSRIPPERVGLDGEYDHSGLAKRVLQAFQAEFSVEELAGVRVMQRGKVVVLMGNVDNARTLNRLISIALRAEGAIEVETNGVRLR